MNTYSWGRFGPQISTESTSREKARELISPTRPSPMTWVASSMISGSWAKLVIDLWNDFNFVISCFGRFLSGFIVIDMVEEAERRKMISVAKRVHRFSLRGNGISVIASRTELFPLDWSPQTTSWGRPTMPLKPVRRSLSTMSITLRWSADWRALRELVVMASGSIATGKIGVSLSS